MSKFPTCKYYMQSRSPKFVRSRVNVASVNSKFLFRIPHFDTKSWSLAPDRRNWKTYCSETANFAWLIYSGQICKLGRGNYIIYMSFYCRVSSMHKVHCPLECRWSQTMDHRDILNQGEPRARRVWNNKRWLNLRKNIDVVKSSRKQDLKYHRIKSRRRLEDSFTVTRYMVMVGLLNDLLAWSLPIHRCADLNCQRTLATGGIFLLMFTAISCTLRFKRQIQVSC